MVVRNRELIARHERNVREAIIEIAVTRSLPLDESKNLIVIMRTRDRAAHPPRALVGRIGPRHRHPIQRSNCHSSSAAGGASSSRGLLPWRFADAAHDAWQCS